MRKIVAWALLCAMLLGVYPVLAEPMTPERALEVIDSYLTEVYSYTAEEAVQFDVRAEWDTDRWRIWFSPAGHPDWVYTATYQEGDPHIENAVTPFWHNIKPANYPGEGAVRDGLRRAREKGWFVIWEDHMRQELAEFISNFGIFPTSKLAAGLATGEITAAEALHEFFVSCYGDELDWAPALKQWYNEEMAFYGFTLGQEAPVEPGVAVQTGKAYNNTEVELTRFIDEVPKWLEPVFDVPQLEGWTCLCGAAAQNVENRYGYGLAAFEKEGERLLAGLKYDMDAAEWKLSPISLQALHTDRDMHILYTDAMNKNRFTIVYQNSPTETERFVVTVGGTDGEALDAFIRSYLRMDEATGNGLKLEIDGGVKASVYENHQKISEENGAKNFSAAMSMLDIRRFPTTIEAWKALEQQIIPQGYALVRGVHLRQKTSSRSKDLGNYNVGVLAKVLGTEPGDPWPWYHVRIGRAEGYMASHYVNEAVTEDTGYTMDRGLPIAQTKAEIKLKKKPAWYAGAVQTLPQGTLMHVLAECDGGWLHVSIPQGEIGWQMDVNGTDGYVKREDVLLGYTPLSMKWDR